MYCEHANECPVVCPCPPECGCHKWGPLWCRSIKPISEKFIQEMIEFGIPKEMIEQLRKNR
jgi:hypothetical protein